MANFDPSGREAQSVARRRTLVTQRKFRPAATRRGDGRAKSSARAKTVRKAFSLIDPKWMEAREAGDSSVDPVLPAARPRQTKSENGIRKKRSLLDRSTKAAALFRDRTPLARSSVQFTSIAAFCQRVGAPSALLSKRRDPGKREPLSTQSSFRAFTFFIFIYQSADRSRRSARPRLPRACSPAAADLNARQIAEVSAKSRPLASVPQVQSQVANSEVWALMSAAPAAPALASRSRPT